MAREILLKPVLPNAGVEAAYRRKMLTLVQQMHVSLEHWVGAEYKRQDPAQALAEDSVVSALAVKINGLLRYWQKRFDDLADDAPANFVKQVNVAVSSRISSDIKQQTGFTIKFNASPAAKQAVSASVAENVQLIKSIPQRHIGAVQGMVMRAVAKGGDVGGLIIELRDQCGVTERRASLIARDQTTKATAVLTRIRQSEAGITEAIWRHSHGGKYPRHSHIEADGRRYRVDEGCLIDGEYIWPGELINCRCYSRGIIPGFKLKNAN